MRSDGARWELLLFYFPPAGGREIEIRKNSQGHPKVASSKQRTNHGRALRGFSEKNTSNEKNHLNGCYPWHLLIFWMPPNCLHGLRARIKDRKYRLATFTQYTNLPVQNGPKNPDSNHSSVKISNINYSCSKSQLHAGHLLRNQLQIRHVRNLFWKRQDNGIRRKRHEMSKIERLLSWFAKCLMQMPS